MLAALPSARADLAAAKAEVEEAGALAQAPNLASAIATALHSVRVAAVLCVPARAAIAAAAPREPTRALARRLDGDDLPAIAQAVANARRDVASVRHAADGRLAADRERRTVAARVSKARRCVDTARAVVQRAREQARLQHVASDPVRAGRAATTAAAAATQTQLPPPPLSANPFMQRVAEAVGEAERAILALAGSAAGEVASLEQAMALSEQAEATVVTATGVNSAVSQALQRVQRETQCVSLRALTHARATSRACCASVAGHGRRKRRRWSS